MPSTFPLNNILPFILALSAWTCFPGNHAKSQNLPEQRILANGLPLVYQMDSSRTLTAVSLTLKGGARLDGQGTDGGGALWSQLFWNRGQDSLRYATYARNRGIKTGARHNLSATQFEMQCMPNRVEDALKLLLFALEDPSYPGQDLQEQRKTYALFLQDLDFNPAIFLERQLGETLWQDDFPELHRYGYYPDLALLKPAHFRDLHRTYLHPENTLLAATGPMPVEVFFQMADSTIGRWSPMGAAPYLHLKAAPDLPEIEYEVFLNELSELPLIQLVWQVEGAFSGPEQIRMAEWFVFAARSRLSPFYERLIESGLARSFNWDYAPTRGPGQLSLQIVPDPAQVKKCLQTVNDILGELANGSSLGFQAAMGAQNQMAFRFASRMDEPLDQVAWYGEQWAVGLSPLPASSAFDATGEQVRNFVSEYLWQQPHVGGLLVNSRLNQAYNFNFEPVWQIPAKDTVPEELPPPVSEAEKAWLETARVYFNSPEFEPDSSSQQAIVEVVRLMAQVPESHLIVNGYSDGGGQGDGVLNYQLSIQRAQSVYDILNGRYGIPKERLTIRPWGEAFPEFEEDTPAKMALNRRVTFDLIYDE